MASAESDSSNGAATGSEYEDLRPLDTASEVSTLDTMDSLTELSRDECLVGLASHSLGRLAISAHALPVILPVRYTLADDLIVFKTRVDGMVARACDGSVVAFQVDNLGRDRGTAWSVLVVGLAALLAGNDALRSLPLPAVGSAGRGPAQFIGITIGRISGSPIHAA